MDLRQQGRFIHFIIFRVKPILIINYVTISHILLIMSLFHISLRFAAVKHQQEICYFNRCYFSSWPKCPSMHNQVYPLYIIPLRRHRKLFKQLN